jgi:hypothetical protein
LQKKRKIAGKNKEFSACIASGQVFQFWEGKYNEKGIDRLYGCANDVILCLFEGLFMGVGDTRLWRRPNGPKDAGHELK